MNADHEEMVWKFTFSKGAPRLAQPVHERGLKQVGTLIITAFTLSPQKNGRAVLDVLVLRTGQS